jgi:hypothetical protein
LVTALREGRIPDVTLDRIRKICGAWRSTVNRWRDYFRKIFPQTIRYWRLSGHLKPQAAPKRLTYNLLEQFYTNFQEPETAIASCLRGLAQGP